jgi:predicted acyl esterase
MLPVREAEIGDRRSCYVTMKDATREIEWSKEETEDMGQVIEWITKLPWSNGKVGTYGMSYSGNTAELAASSNHPAMFAGAPLYPDFDIMRYIAMPGGIYNDVIAKNWGYSVADIDANKKSLFMSGSAPVDADNGEKLLKEAVAGHRTYDGCLKADSNNVKDAKKVIKYYTLGEGKWKTADTWPIPGFHNKTWYFNAGGILSEEKPLNSEGHDTYKVDFTASTGKTNRWFTNCGGGPLFYPDRKDEDQKLLTYTTRALESDVGITGTPVGQ